ncbi:unnamed protein product [Linum trigynum]|uniref:Uncharacterized protein n=1 Tax=Linum trigynum TaxID=586398 RepID=A0AAV2DWH9_9ROSI
MQRSSGFYAATPVATPKVVEAAVAAVKQEQGVSIKQEAEAPGGIYGGSGDPQTCCCHELHQARRGSGVLSLHRWLMSRPCL